MKNFFDFIFMRALGIDLESSSSCNIVKEIPEAFPLPTEALVVKADAGWAHCVSVTGTVSFSLLQPKLVREFQMISCFWEGVMLLI